MLIIKNNNPNLVFAKKINMNKLVLTRRLNDFINKFELNLQLIQ